MKYNNVDKVIPVEALLSDRVTGPGNPEWIVNHLNWVFSQWWKMTCIEKSALDYTLPVIMEMSEYLTIS